MSIEVIFLIALALTVVYLITIYNKFVSLKAGIDASESDIDVQLKRRYNLIPALLETVKDYKDYEGDVLERMVTARKQGLDANSVEDKTKASNLLSGALGKFYVVAEAYPELKANTTFLNLQDELSNIEDAIQNSRRYYNAIVRDYNAKTESFPDVFVAKTFNFTEREYFQLDEAEIEAIRKMPEIDL